MKRCLAALIAVSCAVPLAAQEPSIFRADTRLVVLHATVRNARGEVVTDLDRSAFRVFEDGRPQPIAVFRRDDVPVSLGLLIDNSGSMRVLRPKVEAAALALVRASNPDDEVFVLNFADKPRVDVPFTRNIHTLEDQIGRSSAIGGTAMRDALVVAEDYLRSHAAHDRRVLVVITDGNDNASLTSADSVIRQAETSDTTIDAIGLFRDGGTKGTRRELNRLSRQTGGMALYPATVDEVQAAALDIARQIRQQYTIGYTPTNSRRDGTYRTIRLEVRGHLSVHTRSGYRAE